MCDRFLRQLSSYPLGDDAVAAQLYVVVQCPLVLINWYLIDDYVPMCWIARVVHPSVVLVECLSLCSGQRLTMCSVTVDVRLAIGYVDDFVHVKVFAVRIVGVIRVSICNECPNLVRRCSVWRHSSV